MKCFRRIITPGSVVHIIVRFINREFIIKNDKERDEYLRRIEKAFMDSDWAMISYATMSTHVHLGAIAGKTPFESIARPAHSGFAVWINRRQHRLGPIVAHRPKTIVVPPETIGRLIAYHHNNPVRAGVVKDASESTWTSHNAYIGEAKSRFVNVDLGLNLSGFCNDSAGRKSFADLVALNAHEPSDPLLSGNYIYKHRAEIRKQTQCAIELSYPFVDPNHKTSDYLVDNRFRRLLSPAPNTPLEKISFNDIANAICTYCAVTPQLLSSHSRVRKLVEARRLFVLVCRNRLCSSLVGISSFLNISPEAIRKLELTANAKNIRDALIIVEKLLTSTES